MFNLKEKRYIKCDEKEIERFQNAEFRFNEQIDNLLILISTGALLFSANLATSHDYNHVLFKTSWIILVLGILFSLWNRIVTSEKTSLYLNKFYKAYYIENKDRIEVSSFLTHLELFLHHSASVLVSTGIILLLLAFIKNF